jgi:hypothetical protein
MFQRSLLPPSSGQWVDRRQPSSYSPPWQPQILTGKQFEQVN